MWKTKDEAEIRARKQWEDLADRFASITAGTREGRWKGERRRTRRIPRREGISLRGSSRTGVGRPMAPSPKVEPADGPVGLDGDGPPQRTGAGAWTGEAGRLSRDELRQGGGTLGGPGRVREHRTPSRSPRRGVRFQPSVSPHAGSSTDEGGDRVRSGCPSRFSHQGNMTGPVTSPNTFPILSCVDWLMGGRLRRPGYFWA